MNDMNNNLATICEFASDQNALSDGAAMLHLEPRLLHNVSIKFLLQSGTITLSS